MLTLPDYQRGSPSRQNTCPSRSNTGGGGINIDGGSGINTNRPTTRGGTSGGNICEKIL